MITYIYVYQFVFEQIPESAGDHITEMIYYYWMFSGIAPLHTVLMAIFASRCSPDTRKWLDVIFLVFTLLSFAFFKGYYVASLGQEITRETCYQTVKVANEWQFL